MAYDILHKYDINLPVSTTWHNDQWLNTQSEAASEAGPLIFP